MAIVWPASLPQTPLMSYSKQLAETRIRTETETGPAKVRRRYTAGVLRYNGIAFLLTTAQKATLETFFDTTTAGGSLPWEWQLPDTGATREFRFLEPPTFTQLNHQAYRCTMALEVLPA